MIGPDSMLVNPEAVNHVSELLKNIVLGVTSLVTVASMITALTRTPNKFHSLNGIYRAIEFCALVVGKAKNKE